ncbi:MAG TPA: tetratricopeptide repeat protein [Candidatus Eremiobacteraceae bacterium]|jgi:Flp pilus assembly protein TadD|nr:tetratricopeptide repeat protein [Candidatus Eremiobacteraceae bacterium]
MVTDNLHNAVRICFFRSGWAFLALFCVCSFSAPASGAQKSTPASVPFGARSQSGFPAGDAVVSVVVNVRELGGAPLQGSAIVKLSSDFSGMHLTASTQDAGTATFPTVHTGDYKVEVSSVGYKSRTETAEVMPGNSAYSVYVYLQQEGAADSANLPPSATTMSPKLQSEIDKAITKMRRQQFDESRQHFEKAAKMAPGNPDVQYMWGMLEYYQQHFDLARTKFETAVSINPNHERALVTLGEIQLRDKQPGQAVQTLEKAFLVNGADWRMHYLLAFAYADERNFAKAETHAQRAADLGGKDHSPQARVLLGRILSTEGKVSDARSAFNAVIRDFPADPSAKDAKSELVALDRAAESRAANLIPASASSTNASAISASGTASTVPTPAPPISIRPWAPPDVDAKEYVVAPDVTCSLDTVLQRTQMRMMKQIANFEKFMATEHIEHQDVDAYGNPGGIKSKDFTYLVFIRREKSGALLLDEQRDGGENLSEFPTSLATHGLVGLGVFLFDPDYQDDVTYRCEGLSEWRGQAAWEIRFEQKRDVESRLMTWRNSRGLFPVALKGRAWISSTTYDVLHLETDLRDPMSQLELDRDHLAIDYGPVNFDHGKTSLWLPWYAEMYMQLHGKRYHHRHTLTNYALFSVDTDHQINAPKDAENKN